MAGVRAPSPAEYGACLDVIREARHEAGRGDEPFDALVWARTDGPDDERALAYPEAGATCGSRRSTRGATPWSTYAEGSTPGRRARAEVLGALTGPDSAPGLADRTGGRSLGCRHDGPDRLSGYVDVWWQAVDDFTALLEQLPAEEWSTPTDLAGWDVRAVAAHIAHLEAVLAGSPEETVEVGEPDHVTGLMGLYTEQGVVARRDRSPDAIINEIRSAATARAHRAGRPAHDGTAKPERIFGGIGWDWNTLLRNRPLDVWMHEQDVRRAVGRPGGMDSPAARHTAEYLAESLGLVVAKRVGAEPGTTVVLAIAGSEPIAFAVNEQRRGERLTEIPTDPTVGLAMDREAFILLAGGRRSPSPARSRSPATPPWARRSSTPSRSRRERRHRRVARRGHARPGRADDRRHRHHGRRAGLRDRAELARRGARVVPRRRTPPEWRTPSAPSARRSPTRRSSRRRSTSPTSARYDARVRSCPASGRSTPSSTTPA